MLYNKKISLLIPCYNEEDGIKTIIKTIPGFIDEFIVVDNNCIDNTCKIASEAGAIIVKEKVAGYGSAYKSGLKACSGDVIVTMDGDGSYPLAELESFFAQFKKNKINFISGNRFPLKDKRSMKLINVLGNKILTSFFNFLFSQNIKDSQSGMWVFEREALPLMVLESDGMSFSEEIKLRAILHKEITFGEAHIGYTKRVGTTKLKKWRDGFSNLFFLLKQRIF